MIKVVCVKDRKAMEALRFDVERIAVCMVGNCTGGCGSEGCRGTEKYIIQISDYIDEALGIVIIGKFRRLDDDGHLYRYSLLSVSHCNCGRGYSKEKLRKFIENKFLLGPLSVQFENWEDLPE